MIYVDTSALVKLVVQEVETAALQRWMKSQHGETFFASQLVRIELVRSVTRAAPERIERARELLRGLVLLKIDDEIVDAAENLPPVVLRSLDAIHLATASALRTHVRAFVTYDIRLAQVAKALGLSVVSPS